MKNAPKPSPPQPDEQPFSVVVHVHRLPADELVHEGTSGLERSTFRGLVASGRLPSARLGRRVYCRRSDLLALVNAPPAPPPADARLALAERVRSGRRR